MSDRNPLALLFLASALVASPVAADDAGIAIAKPLRFDTPREAAYWTALSKCTTQLDEAHAWLDGAKRGTRTATLACTNICPPIPACPICETGGCTISHDMVIGGLTGGLGIVGGFLLRGQCPSVAVVR